MILTDLKQLELNIYTLGYDPFGECVFAVIWNRETKNVIKSFLFDCFAVEKVNQITKYLDQYGLKETKLDFLIWTHPDYDHSVGFKDIIKNYISKDTVCILPEGISKWWFIELLLKNRKFGTKSLISVFASWFAIKRMSRKYGNVEHINTSKNRNKTTFCNDELGNYELQIPCNLEILTPIANQVFKKIEVNKNLKGNDISISAILHLGDYGFYFGGDVENDAIREISNLKFLNVKYIKIPHHASKSSDLLPGIFEGLREDFEEDTISKVISVSTSFKKGRSNLPKIKVLDLYKGFSSKIIVTKGTTRVDGYGISKVSFDLCPFRMKASNEIADAFVWYTE